MLIILEAVAMPRGADGLREVRHFAYTSDADDPANLGGSVRDGNNALAVVQQLVGKSATRGETSWYEGEPPRGDSALYMPLWEVVIRVYASRPRISRYQVDYRRHNGCPAKCTDAMMRTYHAVKRAFRTGKESLERERAARKRLNEQKEAS
jgi:hypothetical protein